MIKKDTSEMLAELQSCSDFKSFHESNRDIMIQKSLSELLSELIEIHGIKKADAIKRAEINEIYAYQIFSGKRVPEKKKLLNLCIGMELSFEEIQSLLKVSGYAPLYAKNSFDCIIIHGICKKMTVAEINYLLYDYGEETLS